jgi:tetratricopeptide (TPR) repeat protein
VFVALPAVVAHADDREQQARTHFRRAETHFAVGRFKAALAEYERAFELKPLPGFLFNIGQCHRNLGHLEEAIFSFKKYLQLRPDAKDRPAIDELIADLERQLTAQRAVQQTVTPPSGDLEVPPPPPPPPRPFYTRTWFWTAAAAVVAGSVVGIYFGTRAPTNGPPASGLGNIDFR